MWGIKSFLPEWPVGSWSSLRALPKSARCLFLQSLGFRAEGSEAAELFQGQQDVFEGSVKFELHLVP